MIRIIRETLPAEILAQLAQYQQLVTDLGSYEQQCAGCESLFNNRRDNQTFQEIKSALIRMCSGAARCMYCEDSMSTAIEHHKPKNRYPELVFQWENYLYACSRCNSPKNNRYAVLDKHGKQINVHELPKHQPPSAGSSLLIDPAVEDPLALLKLDLQGTFGFEPVYPAGFEFERARYTIDLLKLNDDPLPEARRDAYEYIYRMTLNHYFKSQNATTAEYCLRALKRHPHPTVWREMVRQWNRLPVLKDYAPEPPNELIWWR